MRKWLDTFGPDKREFLALMFIGLMLVISYAAFVFYLYLNGGDVRGSLYAFAGGFVGSVIASRRR